VREGTHAASGRVQRRSVRWGRQQSTGIGNQLRPMHHGPAVRMLAPNWSNQRQKLAQAGSGQAREALVLKVLIVEDNRFFSEALRALLQAHFHSWC